MYKRQENDSTKIQKDDHYPPIGLNENFVEVQNIPAPRQIFSSGESNEIQLRRLGELMWVYVETLPSTSWPIAKNYFEALSLNIIDANPDTGIILVEFSDSCLCAAETLFRQYCTFLACLHSVGDSPSGSLFVA